jgi:HAMP domain-containing protein
MKLGMAAKIAASSSVISVGMIVVLSAAHLYESSKLADALQLNRLEAIAVTAAGNLAPAQLRAIREDEESFRAVQKQLAAIALANGVEPQLVYLLGAESLALLVTGDPMHNGTPEAHQRPPNRATAAIKNDAGETIVLLEVGAWNSTFVNQRQRPNFLAAVLVSLAGIALIFWTVHLATKKLRLLAQTANAISRGDVERAVPEMGGDEVGELAVAVERLRESTRTGIELFRSSRAP